ncbi:MAG: CoB--CoM heterodisulfide reductase iron-sulfur subunit B family protein, partial [Anaerolineae bacterium]
HMDDNAELEREVEELVRKRRGFTYHGGVEVQHILETFEQFVGLDAIRERVRRPLKGLKFVSYYGCLITRPPKVTEAPHYENPMSMDHIVEALGGESLDWNYKTACCGGSLALSELDMVLNMIARIVGEARTVGADAIVVACPLCHANLDMRQDMLESAEKPIPVVYITELMGLAFGLSPKELGLDKHLVPTAELVERVVGEPERI